MYRLDMYSQWQVLWRLPRHVYIIQIHGNNVVDYMIASENLLTLILYFNVGLNIPRISDHSKLSYRIMANYCSEPGTEKLVEPHPNTNGQAYL